MSFKENTYQQMSFTDSFSGLTAREQKALEKSWAKVFADEIFPAIDEKRFSVLYSDKASRPNTPVNVIVGALIIKELFDYSDDEMVENLMLDFRIQYALHTTSFEEQSLSDKTLSRFPKRCYDYETLHNKDLYHDCVKDLSASIAKLVGISGKVRRMDSMMIESNVRRLSRMELIYTCIAKLAMYVNKINGSALSDDLKHYIDPNDFNRVIYHQRSTDADERMKQLLTDADKLLALCESDYNDSTEYDLFVRCLSEQTIVENENRRLRTKEDGGMKSTMLQNPSDPEATFRNKAGKEHRGYAANLEESVGANGSVVTEYQYEQNNHSDSQFIQEHLAQMDNQEERTVIVTDGAYSGTENTQLAAHKNVELITTSLTGKPAPDILADFEFNEEGTKRGGMDMMDRISAYRELIRKNIDYENYPPIYNKQEVDELIDLIVETLMLPPDAGTIRIGGKERPVSIVKSMFLKLDKDHICYILKCLHNTEKKIGNIKAYLLTALYNAPMTIQNYYTNLANCDLAPDNRQK